MDGDVWLIAMFYERTNFIVNVPNVFFIHLFLSNYSISTSILPKLTHDFSDISFLDPLCLICDGNRNIINCAKRRQEAFLRSILKNVLLKVIIAGQVFHSIKSEQQLIDMVKSLSELNLLLVWRSLLHFSFFLLKLLISHEELRMIRNVQGCQAKAFFEDAYVSHEEQSLTREIQRADIFNLCYLLIFGIEEKTPCSSAGSELTVDDLKLREEFTNLVEVNTVIHNWISLNP